VVLATPLVVRSTSTAGSNGVKQTGGSLVTTGNLAVTSGGAVNLGQSANSMKTAAINAGTNTVTLAATSIVALGTVGTVTGVTASSFTIAAGTAQISANELISASVSVTVNSGAKLDLNGFNETIASLSGAGSLTLGDGTLTTGDNNASTTFSGTISGTGNFVKQGIGTMTLSGSNSYTGETIISGGVLSVGSLANGGSNSGIGASSNAASNLGLDGGTLQYIGPATSTDRLFTVTSNGGILDASGTGAIHFTNTGAIVFNGNTATTLELIGSNTGDNVLAAALDDVTGATTSLTKSGGGFWDLSGTETYTGATQVSGGTLSVDGGMTSPVTVTSGATLSGATGIVTAPVTVNGTLTTGNLSSPIGKLTVGNLSFEQDSAFNITLNGTTPGSTYDQITATGPVDLTGATLNLTLGTGYNPGNESAFDILVNNSNSAITGTFSGLSEGSIITTAGGEQFTITYKGGVNGEDVVLTPVGSSDPSNFENSIVILSSASIHTGTTSTITLQAKDTNGNDITTGGLTVTFNLGSTSGGQGTFSSVYDNDNGTYTATFTGTIAGINTITATVDGVAITTTPPSITITPGSVFPANSVLTVLETPIQLGGTTTVTLQARDPAGNDETTGGLKVAFALANNTGAKGSFGTVIDNHNGTYTATFTGTFDGNNTIIATVNNLSVTSTGLIFVEGGTVSLTESTVTVPPPPITAGTTMTVTLQAVYPKDNPEPAGGLTVLFKLGNTGGGQGTFSAVTYQGNGQYTAVFTGTLAGKNTIRAFIDGEAVTSATPSIEIVTGPLSLANSAVIVSSTSMKAGSTITVTLQPEDAGSNKLILGNSPVPIFTLASGSGTFGPVSYNGKTGAFSATFTTNTTGNYSIVTTYNTGQVTSKQPIITVTPATISLTNSLINVSQSSVNTGSAVIVTLKAVDLFGNLEAIGLVASFQLAPGSGKGTFGKVTYTGNGIYQATFTPISAGTDIIEAFVGGGKVKSTASLTVG
jgi:fibronectin-binding autotransporter adhesin